jgi:hypothetical protein
MNGGRGRSARVGRSIGKRVAGESKNLGIIRASHAPLLDKSHEGMQAAVAGGRDRMSSIRRASVIPIAGTRACEG